MNRRQLQTISEQARKRAVELGEAGDTAAVPELISLYPADLPVLDAKLKGTSDEDATSTAARLR
jgi:hypothetical protein